MAASSHTPAVGHSATRTLMTSAPSSVTVTTRPAGQAVLHLRGAPQAADQAGSSSDGGNARRRRISWATDVIDNEGMGKKKSKVCCIYHAPKDIDESSDESSSDSSSDESESGDDGAARLVRGKGQGRSHPHSNSHGHDRKDQHGKGKERARSPNAYEKQPKVKSKAPKS